MTRSSRPGSPRDRQRPRPQQPQWEAPASTAEQAPPAVEPRRIDLGKRGVALVLDVATAYFVSVIISMIPFINGFLPVYATMVAFLVVRDFLFEGRGIGKNLMGLQVVDMATGRPPDLLQSIQRNIILVAPFVAMGVITVSARFIPIGWLGQAATNLVNLIGMIYCGFVIPLEAYRAYSRADGMRIGDEIAGTTIIESNMDFSNILPRER